MNGLNGLLLIDKPRGCTSHDVVARVRRILGLRGIGHAGTLDPLASGLLVLLLGEATKISDYVLNGDKGYRVKVRLGVTTSTLDLDGEILEERPVEATPEAIRSAALALSGEFEWPVPRHSAVKVDGKKLYEYARKDQDIDVPMRKMVFYDVQVVETAADAVTVDLRCSKGSYIRSWASELGRRLGCGGAVAELRRTFSDPYEVSQAITLEELEERWGSRDQRHGAVLGAGWIPLKDSLPGFRTLVATGQDAVLLKNGQISKHLQARLLPFVRPGEAAPGVKVINGETEDLLSLLLAEQGQFYKIRRVFLAT